MAEDVSVDQKTEEATPKRIQEAEERGNFAHSRELTSAFVLLAAILAFAIAGGYSTRHLMGTWRNLLSQSHVIQPNMEEMQRLMGWVMENSSPC